MVEGIYTVGGPVVLACRPDDLDIWLPRILGTAEAADVFALGETVEYIEVPRDVIGLCVGKSTYARCGIIVNVTPLEPEWCGRITLEISNTTPLPAKIYAGEGIAQIVFLKAEAECRTSYKDKAGKYQDQSGITLPFVS